MVIVAPALPCFRLFRDRFDRWIALSKYGFPFSIGHYSSPVGRFRALARRSRFTGRSHLLRMLAAGAMTLGWPFGAFSTAQRARARMRRYVQEPHGTRVFLDMYWLALRHSIPPIEYALYHFNRAERRKDLHEYVYWNDLPGLAALNARLGADNLDVQDKDRFARICASNGFPHVATLAVFDRGKQIYPEAPFVSDAPVLWIKSLRLKGGAGGAKWVKHGNVYRDVLGRRVPITEFSEEFRKQDCLVQPFIENHPDIAPITNGALASLRIVTGMDAGGHTDFVTALMVLPHGLCKTSVSGILCSVEYEQGRIRRAALPSGTAVANHPDSGVPIIGVVLPCWHESIDLVLRAHATAFSRFAFLGWDIALTVKGPLLLETNSGWGAIGHQMLEGPLGQTSFSRLLCSYV
jgi:Sugar-transfer associated ATP-grasp